MDRPSTTEAPAESEPSSPTRRRGGFLEAVSSSFGTNLFRRLSNAGAVGPEGTESQTPQDDLNPWERLGVTVPLLESFIRTNNISVAMTSGEVCETLIKPATQQKMCTFMDLLVDRYGVTKDPTLTKLPGYFVSHWYASVAWRRSRTALTYNFVSTGGEAPSPR